MMVKNIEFLTNKNMVKGTIIYKPVSEVYEGKQVITPLHNIGEIAMIHSDNGCLVGITWYDKSELRELVVMVEDGYIASHVKEGMPMGQGFIARQQLYKELPLYNNQWLTVLKSDLLVGEKKTLTFDIIKVGDVEIARLIQEHTNNDREITEDVLLELGFINTGKKHGFSPIYRKIVAGYPHQIQYILGDFPKDNPNCGVLGIYSPEEMVNTVPKDLIHKDDWTDEEMERASKHQELIPSSLVNIAWYVTSELRLKSLIDLITQKLDG